jgi:hypothetical protein
MPQRPSPAIAFPYAARGASPRRGVGVEERAEEAAPWRARARPKLKENGQPHIFHLFRSFSLARRLSLPAPPPAPPSSTRIRHEGRGVGRPCRRLVPPLLFRVGFSSPPVGCPQSTRGREGLGRALLAFGDRDRDRGALVLVGLRRMRVRE